MASVRTRLLRWAAVLLSVALASCSGGPNIVPVTGTLTYKGKPVTNALIMFRPEQGRQTWAQTDDQGRFKINYDSQQDGAVVGKTKVWVEMRPTTMAEREAIMEGKKPPLSKDLAEFFEKYSGTNSTLTVDITPNTRDLPLNLD
jgi:hypothetical protein